MARQNGRDLRIKNSLGNVIAVINTKTINFNNTPVDVTGDTDNGFITLLERPASKQISLEFSGYVDDEYLRDKSVNGNSLLETWTIEWLSADGSGTVIYTISGSFFFGPYSETGATDGALEFSGTLSSSGAYEKVTA